MTEHKELGLHGNYTDFVNKTMKNIETIRARAQKMREDMARFNQMHIEITKQLFMDRSPSLSKFKLIFH